MILEAIVTTRNVDGSPNVAPMGPHMEQNDWQQFELRPFQTSQTFENLQRTGQGVLHVTDDVLLFACSAIGTLPDDIALENAASVDAPALIDACQWYEFRVAHIDTSAARASIQCDCETRRRGRDFFGFNRAKHAVIEASILATRIGFLPVEEINEQMQRLASLVEKTGGTREKDAFRLLTEHILACADPSLPSH